MQCAMQYGDQIVKLMIGSVLCLYLVKGQQIIHIILLLAFVRLTILEPMPI